MSLVWDNFTEGGTPKLVMLAMADWCNDAGGSLHPSMPAIAKKACVSESQARRTVHGLIEQGFLSVVGNINGGNPGQSRHYQVNISKITPCMDATPSTSATPSIDARRPLAPMRETPSMDARDPLHPCKPNHQEPPLTTNRTTNTPRAMLASMEVFDPVAADWILLRKQKKAAITQTALDGIKREADKAGISMQDALRICCERGWSGFKSDWVADKQAVKFQTSGERRMAVTDAAIAEWLGEGEGGSTIEGECSHA